jgi:hypothetical protein
MTTRNTLSWRPTDEAARKILTAFAAGGALIGLVGFSVSFASVSQAARPYLGWASWTLPTLVDLGIFVLSGLSLFLELHEISSKLIRLIPTALAGFTVYLNTAEQPTVFGKAVHAAGPLLWIAVVEIATFTVRRLVDLASESAMEKVRASRWLLAPISTFRLWRRMRLWEITDYRVAVGREHERSASRALLRQWYGFGWKAKAPRGERLAVRLQGVTAEPVAELLTRASAGITAAAMAAARPVPQAAEAALDEALAPLDPVLYPLGERPVLAPFTPHAAPFSSVVKVLPSGTVPGQPQNAPENDEDAARRMRGEGLSYGQIADRLGRSKSWAYNVANGAPVAHANGSTP